jgi:hypothetical protein
MAKYRNKKVEVDGILFDSRKEARHWQELRMLEHAGVIQNLRRQEKFLLIPSQKIDGKVVERAVHYIADFVYEDTITKEIVVEDTKNPYLRKEPRYVIKRKLMLYVHGIRIKEI